MDRNINPPAISRQAESFSEIKSHLRSLCEGMARDEKLNLQRALEIGRTLPKLKEMCQHGEWGDALKEIKISSQDASEFTRLAKSPARGISDARSIREALRLMTEADNQPTTSGIPLRGDAAPAASAPANGTVELLKCRACRVGTPKKNCKDCAAMNTPAQTDAPDPEREPGDDTESEETAKKQDAADKSANGKPTFDDRKIIDAVGKIARLLNDRATILNHQRAKEWKEVRDRMNAFLEAWEAWHKKGVKI